MIRRRSGGVRELVLGYWLGCVDVVMHLTRGAIGDFKSAFQLPDYDVDLGVMLEAQEHDSQFNIIDDTTGLKVDVMSAADTP